MHEVLVNRLGGLGLPRKSVFRLTGRPDMTLDVYRGRKTKHNHNNNNVVAKSEKGHNSINISLNLLNNYSGHISIDPKLYAEYQKSSSSVSQDIMLIRFFYRYHGSQKGV